MGLADQAQTAGWQTPTSETQRKSKRAMMRSVDNGRRSGGGQSSSPGLEQEAELAAGILPPELKGPEMEDTRKSLGIEPAGWRSPNLGSGITLDRLVTKDGKPWTPGQRAYDKETGRLCEVGLDQEVHMAGWPTPNCRDTRRGCNQKQLTHVADAAGWPTARATDSIVRHSQRWMQKRIDEHRDVDLTTMANTAGWPTPRANENVQTNLEEIRKKGSSWMGQGRGATVATMAELAGYPTPRTVTGGPESGERKKELGRAQSGGGTCSRLRCCLERANRVAQMLRRQSQEDSVSIRSSPAG